MPSDEALRSPTGPAFTLRKHQGCGLPKQGSIYDMREFSDYTTSVGHIFFHPGTRSPPIPPFAELQAFATANPATPVVVDYDRADGNPCEDAHIVFAELEVSNDIATHGSIVTGANNVPKIRLFTVAADHASRAFDPATHFKEGTQYEGVDIHNWEIVNFDRAYQAATLSGTFRKVFKALSY